MTNLAARLKRLRAGDVLVRRNPVWYGRALRRYDGLERASLDERQSWTEKRLTKVLAAAGKTSWGKQVSAPPSIDDWPILEKERVRDAPESFVQGSTRLASRAETSGTTGVPLSVWRSFSSVADEQAAIDRLLVHVGIDPRDYRVAVLRGDDIKDPQDREPPYWVHTVGGRRLVFSSNHLTAETVDHFAAELARFRPSVLYAYPTILESLCRLLAANGPKVGVPVTLCSSEVVPESTWSLAAETLGTKLVDYYGLAERVSFAYAYAPLEYRFLPGYAYNELVPHSGDGDGDIYELVATGLWNLKMPLVRFRTGDLVRVEAGADPAEVAYGTVAFPEILGRTGDYLVAPDGARLMGIDHIPRGVRNVLRTQVIQEGPEAVRVLVVPMAGFGDEDRATLRANAAKKLPPPMTVSLEVVDDLERTRAGKVPFVIRRSST